jgi:Fic family protein
LKAVASKRSPRAVAVCDLDPMVKMAIIHHQFGSIHPFSDGNGRIGLIINVLYLTHQDLLDIPNPVFEPFYHFEQR